MANDYDYDDDESFRNGVRSIMNFISILGVCMYVLYDSKWSDEF